MPRKKTEEPKLAPKPTKAAPKKIAKSAKTGKIVSKDFAKANPDTTFETVKKAVKKVVDKVVGEDVPEKAERVRERVTPAVTDFTPLEGEKFLCDGFIASVASYTPFTMFRHVVENGVITDNPLDFTSLEGHSCVRTGNGEAMRMLNGG